MKPAPWRWFRAGALVVVFVLSVMPLAFLVPAAAMHPDVALAALSARRLALLVRSVDLAVVVALVATALGTVAALWAWCHRGPAARAIVAIGVVGMFVPPAAHAAGWAALVGTTGAARGVVTTTAAHVTAWLPIAFLIAWLGLSAIDRDAVDAARVGGGDGRAVFVMGLRGVAPAATIAAAMVALLALGDYSVPSTFSVDTYAMEIFAEYAANGPETALALSWPLVALGALTVFSISGPFAALAERAGGSLGAWAAPPRLPARGRLVLAAGAGVFGLGAGLVLVTLGVGTAGPAAAARALSQAAPDLWTTAWVAGVSAVVAGGVALLGGIPAAPGRPLPVAFFAVAVGAVVAPPPVVGAGLIAVWNRPETALLYDSALMHVFASCARFVPLALVLAASAAERLDRAVLETSLVSVRPSRAAFRVVVPQLVPAAVAAALIVLALSAGELGATIMVLQPGSSTATVRAYNLLHYGAASDVAAMALAVALAGVAAAGLAVRALSRTVSGGVHR